MKILFVGFAVPETTMTELARLDRRLQLAAHKLQWNIIDGLEKASEQPVDLISSIPVSNYPLFPHIFIRGSKWKHRNRCHDLTIPFINLPIFKHLTRLISCFISVVTWLVRNKRYKFKQIIVYALHSPHVIATVTATRLFGVNLVLMIPDLPDYMDQGLRRNIIRKLFKPIDEFILKKLMKKAKGLIVLTKQMAQDFAPDVPSIVIEGAVSFEDISRIPSNNLPKKKPRGREKIIMYAGNLLESYGIGLLLDGFSLIPDRSYRLWIYGKGDMESKIKHASSKDNRIKYRGYLTYHEFICKAMEATVLVNPRLSYMKYTRYSFPSKLLDYMKTGRPTITTMLPGIPEEYFDYVYLLKDESPGALAELLVQVCSKDNEELERFGLSARDFVLEKKNSLRQGQRISDFLKGLR